MKKAIPLVIVAVVISLTWWSSTSHVEAVEAPTSFAAWAEDVQDWARQYEALHDRGQGLVSAYNAQYSGITSCSTDGACTGCPTYVNCDSDGNIDGLDFDANPEAVGMVTLLLELQDFINNQPVTTGDYRTSLFRVTH